MMMNYTKKTGTNIIWELIKRIFIAIAEGGTYQIKYVCTYVSQQFSHIEKNEVSGH